MRAKSEIPSAKLLLDFFSESYVRLYGLSSSIFTFHIISKHLIEDVVRHGSLSSHSMFSLEGCLGYFRSSLNGTRGFSNQFIRSKEVLD